MIKKNNVNGLFKLYGPGPQIELLHITAKSAGYSIYLPSFIAQVLGLNREEDRVLIAFIDYGGRFPYVILTRDSVIANKLRPLLYERRKRIESLHKKLRGEIEVQQQSEQQTTKNEEFLSNEAME